MKSMPITKRFFFVMLTASAIFQLMFCSMTSISHASEWELSTVEDGKGPLGQSTSLVLDKEDHPHISYYDQTKGLLMYAHWDGASWQTQEVDDVGWIYPDRMAGRLGGTSIELDSDGSPRIVYCSEYGIKYAYWDTEHLKWDTETIDTSHGISTTDSVSMAIDNDDNPWVTYRALQETRYAYRDGDGIWHVEEMYLPDSEPFRTPFKINTPDIAIDSDGNPHIVGRGNNFGLNEDYLVHSYWDGKQWNFENIEYTGQFAEYRTPLAIDASGNLHIAYHFFDTGERLKYARGYWDEEHSRWNWESQIVDAEHRSGGFPSIAIDRNGNPHISYYYNNIMAAQLRYAHWDGIQWQIEIVDDEAPFRIVGQYTSIAVDSNNRPHISYYESMAGALRYAHWDGTQWVIEVADSQVNVGMESSLALDGNGYPHISYHEWDTDSLKYAYWDGVRWNIQVVDDSGCAMSSLAVDANGYPHVSYWNYFKDELRYASWDDINKKWIIDVIEESSYLGEHSSLALDRDGRPHISYMVGTLTYAYYDGQAWRKEFLDDDASGWSSLALDSNGYPHISYECGINLKYVYWDGVQWRYDTVEEDVCVGFLCNSLALDKNDYPHISYWRSPPDIVPRPMELRYAHWDGTQWNIETVDGDGNWVGEYNSIALDSNGYPHISYSEDANYYLKYAYWDGEKWNIETVDNSPTGTFGSGMLADRHNTIRLDANDNVHISYFDERFENLKYAYKSGGKTPSCIEDVNQDEVVDIFDLVLVAQHIGEAPPKDKRADLNKDGEVNIFDIVWVAKHFGEKCGEVEAAPVRDANYSQYLPLLRKMSDLLEKNPSTGEGFVKARKLLQRLILIAESQSVPRVSKLCQNYPNPFNPETWIPYQLAEPGHVTIKIYNVTGQLIRTLEVGYKNAGIYHSRRRAAYWNGQNEAGERVASGVYFYQLQAGNFSAVRKLVVLK